MRVPQVHIDGIGKLYGGEYENVCAEGVVTFQGDICAETLRAKGILRVQGSLRVDEDLSAQGKLTFNRDVICGQMHLNGMAAFHGSITARTFYMDGRLRANSELQADYITIEFGSPGAYIHSLHGDVITLRRNNQLENQVLDLYKLIFRSNPPGVIECNEIECTEITADHLHCKIIRAHDVRLSAGCKIHRVEYTGTFEADPSATVGEAVRL